MTNDLTLAISAMGARLSSLSDLLKRLENISQCKVVVIVQAWDDTHKAIVNLHPTVTFVWHNELGLSKSRNAALAATDTRYIWFLDDDVQIEPSNVSDALKIIDENSRVDFFRVQIGCIEWQDKFFKNYKHMPKVSRINLLQVSSIEIIARTQFIKKNNIKFNENIGLGTKYQGGEEIHFLLDAWDNGAKFKYIDQVLVRHTCIFEQRVLATNKIFEIRGATASRFKFLGAALLARWCFRYLIKEKNLSFIFSMVKGYLRGYRYFLR